MKDTFDKIMNFGAGLFSLTKEKTEAFVAEMVKRGELRQEEAASTVERIIDRGREERAAFETAVAEMVQKRVGDFVTKADVERMIREILAEQRMADSAETDTAACGDLEHTEA